MEINPKIAIVKECGLTSGYKHNSALNLLMPKSSVVSANHKHKLTAQSLPEDFLIFVPFLMSRNGLK